MSIRFSRAVSVSAWGVGWSLSLLLVAQPARAALGGSPMTPPSGAAATTRTYAPSSTASSLAVMRDASSASASTATPSYMIRETTLGNGTVVREYISTAGSVFGIAWSGPQMPDIASLLGSYFPQYVAGLNARRAALGSRGPGIVDDSGLVVRSGGHMGAFSGQAWLPPALPAGVSGTDIQ